MPLGLVGVDHRGPEGSRGDLPDVGGHDGGRFALGELLTLTPTLKALVARRAPLNEIQAEAARHGWRGLREQALEAVEQGITTMDEVDRVAT